MNQDTKTIYEQWTTAQLEEIWKNGPSKVPPDIYEGVDRELQRRYKEAEQSKEAAAKFREAQEKVREIERAEERRKAIESARAELFTARALVPEVRKRLAYQLGGIARAHFYYGGHAEAFLLEALAMAVSEGRALELVELFRETDFAARWSVTHRREASVVAYFAELFPAKPKQKTASISA